MNFRERIRPWIGGIFVFLLPIVFFHRVGTFDFINLDDNRNVARVQVDPPDRLLTLGDVWSRSFLGLYIPVPYTVWHLMDSVGRGGSPDAHSKEPELREFRPAPYHWLNLGLHALNAALVFFLLRRFGFGEPAAGIGAALFALHPSQVEAFAWVTCLRDLLSASCLLAALFYWVPRPRPFAAGAFFLLSLLAKPTSASFPILAALLATEWAGRDRRRQVRYAVAALVLALPCLVQTWILQGESKLYFTTAWADRPVIALDAIAFYLRNLFTLTERALDYGRAPRFVLKTNWPYANAAGVLAIGALAVWYFRARSRRALAALAGVVVVVLPVLGLKPFLYQAVSTVADRYFYFAFFPLAMLVALAVEAGARQPGARRFVYGVAVAALVIFADASVRVLGTWHDSRSVYTQNLATNPQSWVSYNNLASYYEGQGDFAQAARTCEAWATINPFPDPLFRAGTLWLYRAGEPAKAFEAFRGALGRERGRHPVVLTEAAKAAATLRRYAEARAWVDEALRLDPQFAAAREVSVKLDERERSPANAK